MRRIGEILIDRGVLALPELTAGLEGCRREGGRIGTRLVRLGFVDETALLEALTEQYRLPAVSTLELRRTRPDIRRLIPAQVANRFKAVAFAKSKNCVRVGFVNPSAPGVISNVSKYIRMRVDPFVATEMGVESVIAVQRTEEARSHTRAVDGAAVASAPLIEGPIDGHAFEHLVVAATTPKEVGRLLFRLAGSVYETVGVFSVAKGRIKGWLGAGSGWAPDELTQLSIPEEVDSVFARAVAVDGFAGPLPNDFASRNVARSLGLAFDERVDVLPLRLGDRRVAFVLGAKPRAYSRVTKADLREAMELASSTIALIFTRRVFDR
jgi:hypothetical protein